MVENKSTKTLWAILADMPGEIETARLHWALQYQVQEAVCDELMRRGHSVPSLEDVGTWFSLSYANYFTLPRSIMEAMPIDWQRRFCALMGEVGEAFDFYGGGESLSYSVYKRDERGRFVSDRLSNYRHPDMVYIESLRRRPHDSLGHLVGDGLPGTGEGVVQSGEGDRQKDSGGDL